MTVIHKATLSGPNLEVDVLEGGGGGEGEERGGVHPRLSGGLQRGAGGKYSGGGDGGGGRWGRWRGAPEDLDALHREVLGPWERWWW